MKKIACACASIVVTAFVAVCFLQEYLPFKAQIFIARHIDKPAYMEKELAPRRIKVTDWRTFEDWVNANVHCQADVDLVHNKKFINKIKSFGMAVEMEEEGPPYGAWTNIKRPLHVEGIPVSSIHYWGDSGSEFFVRLHIAPKMLIQKIGAKQQPKYFSNSGYAGVVLTRPPTELDPFPGAIFVRKDEEDSEYSYMGCRMYDY